MEGKQIWSAAFHPADPDSILAGTTEPGVYGSNDGGKSWDRLEVQMAEGCLGGAPKVTNILIDPRDKRMIWVGVEIDGVYCSRDDGQTWKHSKIGDKELNHDVHGVALATGPRTKLLVTTPDGLWSSLDEGESWSLHGFPKFGERDTISYCRGVALKPGDPDTIFFGNRDFIPDKRAAIQRSRDFSAIFETC